MLKWQLLAELLSCSMKIVALRSRCGAINDARLQCLEALKLAIKLQAPSQYVLSPNTVVGSTKDVAFCGISVPLIVAVNCHHLVLKCIVFAVFLDVQNCW